MLLFFIFFFLLSALCSLLSALFSLLLSALGTCVCLGLFVVSRSRYRSGLCLLRWAFVLLDLFVGWASRSSFILCRFPVFDSSVFSLFAPHLSSLALRIGRWVCEREREQGRKGEISLWPEGGFSVLVLWLGSTSWTTWAKCLKTPSVWSR